MAEALALSASFFSAVCGMAWLALAMKPHWAQLQSGAPHSAAVARRLRVVGALALCASLALCFSADHASMASLVWVMTLSASALIVAMTLAYRPRWLSFLRVVAGAR
jgi:hypothetical protein